LASCTRPWRSSTTIIALAASMKPRVRSSDALASRVSAACSSRRCRYCASWPPTVANIAATSPLCSWMPVEKNSSTPAQSSPKATGKATAVIRPARSACVARSLRPSAATLEIHWGRRNA
jgi:hypothetical protein